MCFRSGKLGSPIVSETDGGEISGVNTPARKANAGAVPGPPVSGGGVTTPSSGLGLGSGTVASAPKRESFLWRSSSSKRTQMQQGSASPGGGGSSSSVGESGSDGAGSGAGVGSGSSVSPPPPVAPRRNKFGSRDSFSASASAAGSAGAAGAAGAAGVAGFDVAPHGSRLSAWEEASEHQQLQSGATTGAFSGAIPENGDHDEDRGGDGPRASTASRPKARAKDDAAANFTVGGSKGASPTSAARAQLMAHSLHSGSDLAAALMAGGDAAKQQQRQAAAGILSLQLAQEGQGAQLLQQLCKEPEKLDSLDAAGMRLLVRIFFFKIYEIENFCNRYSCTSSTYTLNSE